jgi:excisionase family DNA binding protein
MTTLPVTYITINAAAERLSCHPKTVRRLVSAGQLTAFRVGPRMLRLDVAEIDKVLRPVPTVKASSAA